MPRLDQLPDDDFIPAMNVLLVTISSEEIEAAKKPIIVKKSTV